MKIQQLGTDSTLLGGVAAATTARTASLDTLGADYATIRINVGVRPTTNVAAVSVSMSESDDNTTFVTFNSSFTRSIDNSAAAIVTNHIDLEGRKRYLKLTVTPHTHTANGPIITSADATLYKNVISASATMLGPSVVVG